MNILVTGGAGFIGANFLNLMVPKYPEDHFVCLDILGYAGHLESLEVKEAKNFAFVKGDIADRDLVDSLFAKYHFDYVINFAAESHVDRSLVDPSIFIHSNIEGVSSLLDACRKYGVKRYHQVSTDEVYGDLPLERKDLFFDEASPLKPSSPYSASKASADLLVLAYHRSFGLDVTITRCSNNYGPYQYPEKLIPLFLYRLSEGEKVPVYGEGKNVRDWLYVEDHCRAIDLVVRKGISGQIYNVGGHGENSNLEVVRALLKAMGLGEDRIEFVKDRPGHDLRYAINPKKINELGWKPLTDFETGLKKTIDWYLHHQDWTKKVQG